MIPMPLLFTTILPGEAAQMTGASDAIQNDAAGNVNNHLRSKCVKFTPEDLQEIIRIADGRTVQFQFAINMEEGTEHRQPTLVIAFPAITEGGDKTFLKPLAGKICPPPESCML